MTFENGEAAQKSQSHSAMGEEGQSKFAEDAYKYPPANPVYIDKVSSLIADALDHEKLIGQERYNATSFGPSHISEILITDALSHLHGDDYNKMLLEIKEKNDAFAKNPSDPLNERPWMEHLHLDKWDEKTGTWDNVTIDESQFPHSVPTRIVQPGNTLDSIVTDRLVQLNPNTSIAAADIEAMKTETAKINNLPKVDTPLYLGEAIKLPR